MTEGETNEFEEMYNTDDFGDTDSVGESSEEQSAAEQDENDDLIASGPQGVEYDISKAPKVAKGPDRENLDEQTVTITDVKVILPSTETEWTPPNRGKTPYKPVRFELYYDNDGQREFYSGMKVFKNVKNGKEYYSDPVIQNNGTSQASKLKKAYADFKEKKPEEISMHEFLSFLKSKPKAVIAQKTFEYNGNETAKNIVDKFVQ